MKKDTNDCYCGKLTHFIRCRLVAAAAFAFLFGLAVRVSYGDSGTWVLNPISGDWNTAANWSSIEPPNGPFDTATFGVSNGTDISISTSTTVFNIGFNVGARAFNTTCPARQCVRFVG